MSQRSVGGPECSVARRIAAAEAGLGERERADREEVVALVALETQRRRGSSTR